METDLSGIWEKLFGWLDYEIGEWAGKFEQRHRVLSQGQTEYRQNIVSKETTKIPAGSQVNRS